MKKIYFLMVLLCLWNGRLLAQTDNSPLRQRLNFVFANLNKSQVPHRLLAEYGYELMPMDVFNGTLIDSNRVNPAMWRLLYTSLQTAHIYGANPVATTMTTVNSTIQSNESTTGPIPIMVLHYNYATLRTDALTANLLRVQSDQLYDVAGRAQSPYNSRMLFAACPSKSFSMTSQVSFIFKQPLYYTNAGKFVSALSIDMGDGRGYLGVSWNTAIAANYTTTGTKRIKMRMRFSDGQIVESHSDFRVLRVTTTATARYANNIFSPNAPFNTPSANHAGGQVQIHFSTSNTTGTIRKPLIIVEGYDASSVAPALVGDYTLTDFIAAIDNPTNPFNLNRNLDENALAQYDLVFLNYRNGTDDIRRNAALLQELIVWVNGQKSTSERNVLLGISMGGLVARYALADMEKRRRVSPSASNDHQTRLLLTHDSPHRGANVPVGVQALLGGIQRLTVGVGIRLSELFVEANQVTNLFNAPATRQLLLYRVENNAVQANTFLDNDYRSMITFPAGSPAPYREVAASLGSECGTATFAPSTELARASGNFFLSPLPFLVRNNYRTEIILNALPAAGTTNRVYSFRIWRNTRILLVIPINTNLFNETLNTSNLLPVDGAAGGTYPINTLVGQTTPSLNFELNFLIFFQVRARAGVFINRFTFVPTPSALDVTTLNPAALTDSYSGGTHPSNPSRFANFIAQERPTAGSGLLANETHIRFTNRNSRWMFNEMRAAPQAVSCSYFCSNPAITGPDNGCNGLTYSIPSIAGATYTWTPGPNLSIASGQGSHSVTLSATGGGSSTISVSIGGDCGNYTLTKSIGSIARIPAIPGTIFGPTYISSGDMESYDIDPVPGATSYQWSVPSDWLVRNGDGTTMIGIQAGDRSGYVSVAAINACGMGVARQIYVTVSPGGGGHRLVRTFPNPANTYMEVNLQTLDDSSAYGMDAGARKANDEQANEAIDVKLYNRFGQLVWSDKTQVNTFRINTATLPSNHYFLWIKQGEEIIRKQIIIQH